MTVHVDTLEIMKTSTSAGVENEHAEAMARAHAQSLDEIVTTELATKSDLKVLSAEIMAGIGAVRTDGTADDKSLRAELKTEIDTLRAD